jgi:hypothetical protein
MLSFHVPLKILHLAELLVALITLELSLVMRLHVSLQVTFERKLSIALGKLAKEGLISGVRTHVAEEFAKIKASVATYRVRTFLLVQADHNTLVQRLLFILWHHFEHNIV